MEPGILHIVVWLKNKLSIEGPAGDLTGESRASIEDFVQRTFVRMLPQSTDHDGKDQIMWFKNWAGLQSVRGIEHVHILARDISDDTLSGWLRHDQRLP